MIHSFDSIEQFVTKCRSIGLGARSRWGSNADWSGGLTTADAMDKALVGDNSLVERAEKLIEQINSEVEITSPSWIAAPYGAVPCVPAYLAGDPCCMRTMVHEVNERATVRLYVGIASSGAFSNDALMTRGCAILALYMALQRSHPVEVHVCHEGNGTGEYGAAISDVRITSEIDSISSLAFCLAHPAFDRQVHMEYLTKADSYRGGWPDDYNGGRNWEPKFRKLLGMSATDIYIPGSYLGSTDMHLMVGKPVEWVNARLEALRSGENTTN